MRRTSALVLAVVALVSLATAPAWAGPNVWTGSGPNGAAVRSVLVDQSAPSTIYLGTLRSGVFKSTDGGGTWAQKGLEGLTVRALVRDPAPPAKIYAGVENAATAATGGVFVSEDGGDTWTPLDNGLTNKRVLSLALDGSTLYAGTFEESGVSGRGVQVEQRQSHVDPDEHRPCSFGTAGRRRMSRLPAPGAGARHRLEVSGNHLRRDRGLRGIQVRRRRSQLDSLAEMCQQPGLALRLPSERRDPGPAGRRDAAIGDALRRGHGEGREHRLHPHPCTGREPRAGPWSFPIHEQRSELGPADERASRICCRRSR